LTVGNGLLGQVVVDDQGVLAVVTEPFTHSYIKKVSKSLLTMPSAVNMYLQQPANGAMYLSVVSVRASHEYRMKTYCRGAASEAVAATMMVYFMASFSSRVLTSWATVDRF
jgi:hypothetical protein